VEVKAKGSTNKGADWQPIAVDADGHVQGDIKSLPGAGLNALITAVVDEEVTGNKAGAADDALQTTQVPAGQLHVITHIATNDPTNDLTSIVVQKRVGANYYLLTYKLTIVRYETVEVKGPIYLQAGARIRATFNGGVAGDVIRLVITGYKMTPP